MRVRLTQLDGKLPNLALMKLAHFHRARGDTVYFSKHIERERGESTCLRGELRSIDRFYATRLPAEMRLLRGAEEGGYIRQLEQEHITPEVVGKMAAKAGVKAVVVTHLVATFDPNDDYQRYVDGAKTWVRSPWPRI